MKKMLMLAVVVAFVGLMDGVHAEAPQAPAGNHTTSAPAAPANPAPAQAAQQAPRTGGTPIDRCAPKQGATSSALSGAFGY